MKADIIWLEAVDSTNEEARRRISDIDNLSVVSAVMQTAGRGQRGNTWSSEAGENLTFSIVMKFKGSECKATDSFILTEIASLSMVRFLAEYGIEARIKWPNDIYVGSRKICGMLIENSIRSDEVSSSIIGIGLNINQRNFDVNLPNPTSMALCSRESQYVIRTCLERFMEIFEDKLDRYIYPQSPETHRHLREEYLENLWLIDEAATFIDLAQSKGRFKGMIRGISPIGHLIVEDMEKGELREFAFKDIGYVIP
jgi:BirA family biotin operon repressor/biotin-[acetyl-CoA-carboxylase] ligase